MFPWYQKYERSAPVTCYSLLVIWNILFVARYSSLFSLAKVLNVPIEQSNSCINQPHPFFTLLFLNKAIIQGTYQLVF